MMITMWKFLCIVCLTVPSHQAQAKHSSLAPKRRMWTPLWVRFSWREKVSSREHLCALNWQPHTQMWNACPRFIYQPHIFESTCTPQRSGMLIFRFSAEFHFFVCVCFLFFVFFFFCFLKSDFPIFVLSHRPKKKKKKLLVSNTATIGSSKSFGKQSLASWFVVTHFFRFRSKFESTVSPFGTQNLTPAGCPKENRPKT